MIVYICELKMEVPCIRHAFFSLTIVVVIFLLFKQNVRMLPAVYYLFVCWGRGMYWVIIPTLCVRLSMRGLKITNKGLDFTASCETFNPARW